MLVDGGEVSYKAHPGTGFWICEIPLAAGSSEVDLPAFSSLNVQPVPGCNP